MAVSSHAEVKSRNQEAFALVAQIKLCGEKKDLQKGTQIHACVLSRGFSLEENPHLCNSLVDMYAKCGILSKAQDLHAEYGSESSVSWNALMCGYAQKKQTYEAFDCFQRMKTQGLYPNAITYSCILKVCGSMGNIEKGWQIHEEIVDCGLLTNNVRIGNALIDMYGKCSELDAARHVLEELLDRDVVSWSTLISSYVKQGHCHEAFTCYEKMQTEGFVPDAITFNSVLKACGDIGDIQKGEEIHREIVSKGFLEKNLLLGTSLVDMYAKCGALARAQEVLLHLPFRDDIAWSALIAGYARHGSFHEALNTVELMRGDGVSPNEITLICMLTVCGNIGNIVNGKRIHHEIVTRGLEEENIHLSTALITMYAKCGEMLTAQQLHDEQYDRILDSWSASSVAEHTQDGRGEEALDGLQRMVGKRKRISPDSTILTCILSTCGCLGDICRGKAIHDRIEGLGLLEGDTDLACALINMYVQCGALATARLVHDEIDASNVVKWSTLISGYIQHAQEHEALDCFQEMLERGASPDELTFLLILKACGNIGCIRRGQIVHSEIVCKGFNVESILLGIALIEMYVNCGMLCEASRAHDGLNHARSIRSWNMLIGGHSKQGQARAVLDCFQPMLRDGVPPDAHTFVFMLEACGSIKAVEEGERFHDEIRLRQGLLQESCILGTALLDMYFKCAQLDKAREVLEELPSKDVISWSVLISGYAHQGQGQEAVSCFERMQLEGVSPDEVAFISITKACGSIRATVKGKHIHSAIIHRGFLSTNAALGNALVDMYIKCGVMADAEHVFHELPLRSVVSWSTLISGYAQAERGHEALERFEEMRGHGISPNVPNFLGILKACGSAGAIGKGKQIHGEIVSRSLLGKDTRLCTAVVHMYARCGIFATAQEVLDQSSSSDTVSWNALMSECTKQGQVHGALECYGRMKSKGIPPNAATFLSILKVCGAMGAFWKGKQVHEEIESAGFRKEGADIALGNAIVDMYGRLGVLSKAQDVFDEIPVRDVVSWNALIGGYARNGHGQKACSCFGWMQIEGICPDRVTFLCLLNALSCSGLLQEAQMCFRNMTRSFGSLQGLEQHHSCMVTLLGCAGYFEEARSVIQTMPATDLSVGVALLSACRRWSYRKLGGSIFSEQIRDFAHSGSF